MDAPKRRKGWLEK
jgi:hypothetical protein